MACKSHPIIYFRLSIERPSFRPRMSLGVRKRGVVRLVPPLRDIRKFQETVSSERSRRLRRQDPGTQCRRLTAFRSYIKCTKTISGNSLLLFRSGIKPFQRRRIPNIFDSDVRRSLNVKSLQKRVSNQRQALAFSAP